MMFLEDVESELARGTGTMYQELRVLREMLPGAADALLEVVLSRRSAAIMSHMEASISEAGIVKGRSTSIVDDRPETLKDGDASFLRPNGQTYWARPWGEFTDVAVLRTARDLQHFVFLRGAPGCGKTAVVEAAFGENLITVVGSGDTELADFIGGFVPTNDPQHTTGFRWVDGPLLIAAEEGRPLLIDEIGLIESKVLAGLYGLMDGRGEIIVTANPERGVVKSAPGFFVLGATNPHAPGVKMSEALLSRFTLHVEMTTDWALATTLGVDPKFVRAAQNLDHKRANGTISWGPQMRELLNARDLTATYGLKFAVDNLIALAPEDERDVIIEVMDVVFGVSHAAAYI